MDSYNTWQTLLNDYPCSGPAHYGPNQYSVIPGGLCYSESWNTGNKWIESPKTCSDEHTDGHYNGLDYLLLYNLYHLVAGSQTIYTQAKGCNCEGYDDPIPETGPVSRSYSVERKQNSDTWNGFGYELYEYSSGHKIFNTKNLQVNSGLIFCKGQFDFDHAGLTIGDGTKQGNLVIQNGGTLLLQSEGVLNIEEGSTFTLEEYGKLILENGCTVRVKKNATLLVKSGGQMILRGGAFIQEPGSKVIIHGTVSIENNHIWNPSGSGRLQFGENAAIIASGGNQNRIRFDHPGLEIWVENETGLDFPPSLESFEILNTRIYLGQDAFISILSKFAMNGGILDRWPGENAFFAHKGIVLWGQEGFDPRDQRILIANSQFRHAKVCLRSEQLYFSRKSIILEHNQFSESEQGVVILNGGGYLFGNHFTGIQTSSSLSNSTALTGINTRHFLNIESNLFQDFTDAIVTTGSQGYKCILGGNVFRNNGKAVSVSNAGLALTCNAFVNNFWTYEGNHRSYINASREKIALPVTSTLQFYGGDNYTYSNLPGLEGVQLNHQSIHHIRLGNNEFDQTRSRSSGAFGFRYFEAYLERPSGALNGFLTLDADFNQNYWGSYSGSGLPGLLLATGMQKMDYAAELFNNQLNVRSGIYGSLTNGRASCQLPEWQDVYLHGAFVPGTRNSMLFKNIPVNGILDPAYSGHGTYLPTGSYSNSKLGDALNAVTQNIHQLDYDHYSMSMEGFLQFGNLLREVISGPADFDLLSSALNEYLGIGWTMLELHRDNPMNKLLVYENISEVLNRERTWLNSSETENIRFYKGMMFTNCINHAYLEKGMNNHEASLSHLQMAHNYLQSPEDGLYTDAIECTFENEYRLLSGLCTRQEFLEVMDQCLALNKQHQLIMQQNRQNMESGNSTSGIRLTIQPNPVNTSLKGTLSNDEGNERLVIIRVYDKFGNNVLNKEVLVPPGTQEFDFTLPQLTNDVYSLVYNSGSQAATLHFILQR